MKLLKVIAAGAIIAGLSMTSAMADYNKGFKYYNKMVKKKSKLKSSQMLKLLNIKTAAQLEALLANNAKGLIAALKAKGQDKAAKGIEKIVKKHKLNDLKDFLVGIMNGKIPAGCS
jgi:hypothetical protein